MVEPYMKRRRPFIPKNEIFRAYFNTGDKNPANFTFECDEIELDENGEVIEEFVRIM